MDDYSHRREVLTRIAELLKKMPDDILVQLIQGWETELSELLEVNSTLLINDEPESSASNKTQ